MNTNNPIKGYKVFNPDWTCRGKQYTCPGRFEEDVDVLVRKSGMHFCKKALDCFKCYAFDPNNKVAEVVAYGTVAEERDTCCTDKLEIVREISWSEVLELVNLGKDNSGKGNSGDYNSGDSNSGNSNSGNWNSGDRNSGDSNSGDWNSGNWNSGDSNSGNWNLASSSNGCFNTVSPKIYLFDKPSEWTLADWRNSTARFVLLGAPKRIVYIHYDDMTAEEHEAHPEAKTTGGYLKKLSADEVNANMNSWWKNLPKDEQDAVKAIPNFDPEIFRKITGIDVNEKGETHGEQN